MDGLLLFIAISCDKINETYVIKLGFCLAWLGYRNTSSLVIEKQQRQQQLLDKWNNDCVSVCSTRNLEIWREYISHLRWYRVRLRLFNTKEIVKRFRVIIFQ